MAKAKFTSEGGGLFQWKVKNIRISYEDQFRVSSPPFIFSGLEYKIVLKKQNRSYSIGTTLSRTVRVHLPPVSFECELRSGEESVSPSYTVTTDGGMDSVRCGVDIYGYLSKRNNSVLFPCLSLSLRMEDRRTHPGLKRLQKDLKKLFMSQKDADVTLRVQGKEYLAHKAILRSRSPVFDAMFSHDMEEKLSGAVSIEDCDNRTFPDFLNYLYTGSTEHVSGENVCQLYAASDKYEVMELTVVCREFMKSYISVETFCDFISLALKHQDGELIDSVTKFFCNNVVRIVESAKWQTFLTEYPIAGNELFLKAWKTEKIIIKLSVF